MNNSIRRMLVMFLLLAMVVSITACGGGETSDPTEAPSATISGEESADPTAESGGQPTTQDKVYIMV